MEQGSVCSWSTPDSDPHRFIFEREPWDCKSPPAFH